jgi:hypothetical protein
MKRVLCIGRIQTIPSPGRMDDQEVRRWEVQTPSLEDGQVLSHVQVLPQSIRARANGEPDAYMLDYTIGFLAGYLDRMRENL